MTAIKLIEQYRSKGKKIPGFGHRYHSSDPRIYKLLSIANELKISGKYVTILMAIINSLSNVNK